MEILKKSLILLTILIATIASQAQSQEKVVKYRKNAFYTEFSFFSPFDVWFAYSINYERMLLQRNNIKVSARAGAGSWAAWAAGGPQILIGSSLIWGKKNHHIELQGGYYMLKDKEEAIGISGPVEIARHYHKPYVQVGYRFQKPGGRFLLKVHTGLYGAGNIGVGFIL